MLIKCLHTSHTTLCYVPASESQHITSLQCLHINTKCLMFPCSVLPLEGIFSIRRRCSRNFLIFQFIFSNTLQAPSFSAPKPFSYTPAAPFAPAAAAAPPKAGPLSPSSYPPAQPTWTPSAAPAPVVAAPKPVAPVNSGPSQGAY